MNKNKKRAIVAVLVIVLLVITAVCAWYFKEVFYVPDRNGMVYEMTNTINVRR